MAYTRSIERKCSCGNRATVEVLNTRNARMGEFCKPCGQRLVKKLNDQEHVEAQRLAASAGER